MSNGEKTEPQPSGPADQTLEPSLEEEERPAEEEEATQDDEEA